ncbi:MAG: nitronate monooxygenase [Alphaproteobacteria bacterium]|nr:nitronate monooxygenase [Alphaproteobacteria bacterium]
MINLKNIVISGKEVCPIIEGGKGINGTDGRSSGHFAKEGCVGTISLVSADYYDDNGNVVMERSTRLKRQERHEDLIKGAIKGGIAQAQIAHEIAGNNGRIHVNELWELADSEQVIRGVLEGAKGLIHGVTCGAGLPYKLGEIASEYGVYYYPIVSSARAFQILWKRAYSHYSDFLGGVVYEDPWLAGGHNGLSNAENPDEPQDPYNRIKELRATLVKLGLAELPIVIAGGVWCLQDWENYLDNPEIGKVAFQFGTRPMITTESPISDAWKKVMLQTKPGDVALQRFSPTGFYSSAIKNKFLKRLMERKEGEIAYRLEAGDGFGTPLTLSNVKTVYIKAEDLAKANNQINAGFSVIQETPDSTVVFLTPDEWKTMKEDRAKCLGCLSQCQFSAWSGVNGTTGKLCDPRTYCIHKTLFDISHNGSTDDNLLFAGHQVYRFGQDPLYANGHIPSTHELVEAIKQGR